METLDTVLTGLKEAGDVPISAVFSVDDNTTVLVIQIQSWLTVFLGPDSRLANSCGVAMLISYHIVWDFIIRW